MNFLNRKTRFVLNIAILLTVSVTLFWMPALTVSAQTNTPSASIPNDYGLTTTAKGAKLPVGEVSPVEIASMVVNSLLSVLGVLLIILIIYAGFLWMTAAGDEQKISKAKKILGNAVVGLIIILASYAIASFTIDSLEKGTGGASDTSSGGSSYCSINYLGRLV